jgi:hypothetical protein
MRGQVTLRRTTNYRGDGIPLNWTPESACVSNIVKYHQQRSPTRDDDYLAYQFGSRFHFGRLPNGLYVPHWFLVLLATTFATLPWIRYFEWRFSLRTLLIATTLVAVVLGLIVWAVR